MLATHSNKFKARMRFVTTLGRIDSMGMYCNANMLGMIIAHSRRVH